MNTFQTLLPLIRSSSPLYSLSPSFPPPLSFIPSSSPSHSLLSPSFYPFLSGRRNRNDYAQLMLHMLKTSGLLDGPFELNPENGYLPSLTHKSSSLPLKSASLPHKSSSLPQKSSSSPHKSLSSQEPSASETLASKTETRRMKDGNESRYEGG